MSKAVTITTNDSSIQIRDSIKALGWPHAWETALRSNLARVVSLDEVKAAYASLTPPRGIDPTGEGWFEVLVLSKESLVRLLLSSRECQTSKVSLARITAIKTKTDHYIGPSQTSFSEQFRWEKITAVVVGMEESAAQLLGVEGAIRLPGPDDIRSSEEKTAILTEFLEALTELGLPTS